MAGDTMSRGNGQATGMGPHGGKPRGFALPRPVISAVSILAGLFLWDLVARQFSDFIIARPWAVVESFWTLMISGRLFDLLSSSLVHMLAGYGLAVVVAIPLGMLLGRNATLRAMTDPVVGALYSIPTVAFVPFVVVWFGLLLEARIALVFMMCVLDMLVIMTAGVRDIDPAFVRVGRSFGASRLQMARLVLLPASLPLALTALRIGIIRAVNGMITAELLLAAVNFGSYMKNAAGRFDSASVISVLVVFALLGLLFQSGLRLIERLLLPHQTGR